MMSGKGKQTPKKGIGKPKELNKSTMKVKSCDPNSSETSNKEYFLSFPLLKTVDNDRMLPRYSAILNRSEEDGVGMEDLDALQLELEALLSAVVVRSRVLQEEIQVLSNAEEKRDKKAKAALSKPPLSPGKRAKQYDKPTKKLKESSTKIKSEGGTSPLPIKFTKPKSLHPATASPSQNPPLLEHELPDPSKLEAPKLLLPKNDTPNKFWLSVEPYCADITSEDLKLLDELINEHETDAEYQKIPPLGRHYSLRWAQEDLMEEHEASVDPNAHSRNKFKTADISNHINNMVKRVEKPNEGGNTGPLTQRLISALMEENIMVPLEDSFDAKRIRGGENITPPRLGGFRSYAVSNSSTFERRVRKELEEQGMLEAVEPGKEPADDEILLELKRCQNELKTISSHNLEQLKRLRQLATEEVTRQELKKRLQHVDSEVLEIYRRIQAGKLKKKPVNKKDQEQAIKALKDREVLVKQIDALKPIIP